MSFNPLGSFIVDAPLNAGALSEARSLLALLPTLPHGTLDHEYGHWTVGHLDQNFPDYNLSVGFDGTNHHIKITHDPSDNARGVNNNTPAEHTWLRNTGGLGISLDAMVGASVHNFGDEGVTLMGVEYLCAAVAAGAVKYGIDLAGKTPSSAGQYANEDPFMTHAIAAVTGGNPAPTEWYDYGVTGTMERWDFLSLVALPEGVAPTLEMAQVTCAAIAARARLYKAALQ